MHILACNNTPIEHLYSGSGSVLMHLFKTHPVSTEIELFYDLYIPCIAHHHMHEYRSMMLCAEENILEGKSWESQQICTLLSVKHFL